VRVGAGCGVFFFFFIIITLKPRVELSSLEGAVQQYSVHRCQAGAKNFHGLKDSRTENGSGQSQNLAWTGTFVPSSLDSGPQIENSMELSERECPSQPESLGICPVSVHN